MLTQDQVTDWLDGLVTKLREQFGDRLVYVGHHGSWARGEAHEDSDIDAFVVLDDVRDEDLEPYRRILASMPDAARLASTFLGSVEEVRAWPRHDLVECWYGCRALHGDLRELVAQPTQGDMAEDVRIKAAGLLHLARHYLLHPRDLTGRLQALHTPFKESFFALQSWTLLTAGVRYERKADLVDALAEPLDAEVARVARDWRSLTAQSDAEVRAYAGLLERWARSLLRRVAEWDRHRPSRA